MAHEKLGETKEELEAIAAMLRKRIRDLRDRISTLEDELKKVEEKMAGLRD